MQLVPFKIRFPKNKETGVIPPPIDVQVNELSVGDIINILERNDEREVSALVSAVNDVIKREVRKFFTQNDPMPPVSAYQPSDFTWFSIANDRWEPEGRLDDVDWDAFKPAFIAFRMAQGASEKGATLAAELCANELNSVKNNIDVLKALAKSLQAFSISPEVNAENAAAAILLTKRANRMIRKLESAKATTAADLL